jgi:hypothetical protein
MHGKAMLSSLSINISEEYRKTAESLFPPQGYQDGQAPSVEVVREFAEILGVGTDYKRLLDHAASYEHAKEDQKRYLGHFQNNLDLLIQKTWVNKIDEERKECLLDRVPGFISLIEQGDIQKALAEFGVILDELAYLFFGIQSNKADFTEYTFRIDTQIGLFWWYGGQLGRLQQIRSTVANDGCLKAILLLGICYLTNF